MRTFTAGVPSGRDAERAYTALCSDPTVLSATPRRDRDTVTANVAAFIGTLSEPQRRALIGRYSVASGCELLGRALADAVSTPAEKFSVWAAAAARVALVLDEAGHPDAAATAASPVRAALDAIARAGAEPHNAVVDPDVVDVVASGLDVAVGAAGLDVPGPLEQLLSALCDAPRPERLLALHPPCVLPWASGSAARVVSSFALRRGELDEAALSVLVRLGFVSSVRVLQRRGDPNLWAGIADGRIRLTEDAVGWLIAAPRPSSLAAAQAVAALQIAACMGAAAHRQPGDVAVLAEAALTLLSSADRQVIWSLPPETWHPDAVAALIGNRVLFPLNGLVRLVAARWDDCAPFRSRVVTTAAASASPNDFAALVADPHVRAQIAGGAADGVIDVAPIEQWLTRAGSADVAGSDVDVRADFAAQLPQVAWRLLMFVGPMRRALQRWVAGHLTANGHPATAGDVAYAVEAGCRVEAGALLPDRTAFDRQSEAAPAEPAQATVTLTESGLCEPLQVVAQLGPGWRGSLAELCDTALRI